MSYKLTINAMSQIGDNVNCLNEAVFADGISSVSSGVCAPLDMKTKSRGRKHVIAVMSSENSFEAEQRSLKEILSKQNTSNLSIKVQFALKSILEQLYDSHGSNSEKSDLAMLYTDGKNAYVAGYGNVNAYYYNSKTKTVQKVEFVGSRENTEIASDDDSNVITIPKTRLPARVKRVASLNSGDEYLLVGENLCSLLGDEQIIKIFGEHKSNAVKYLASAASQNGCRDNITATHVSVKKQYFMPILLMVAIVAAISLVGYFVYSSMLSDNEEKSQSVVTTEVVADDKPEEQAEDEEENTKEELNEASSESSLQSDGEEEDGDENEEESEPEIVNSLDGLSSKLDTLAAQITGDNSKVAYYIKNLATGEVLEKNDSKMYSASLIKLYIMAEIYRQVDAGELTMDSEIENLLIQMITVSSNDACNELATIAGGGDQELGFQRITQNAINLGCQYTVQGNDLLDSRPVPIPVGNFTSVKDCGLLLEKIYNGELVSYEASSKMLELLKGQQRRFKIPRDLPEGVVVANKTGENSSTQNDVAIVYSPNADYIICIMINDYGNSMDEAMDIVAKMSKTTYDYITNGI